MACLECLQTELLSLSKRFSLHDNFHRRMTRIKLLERKHLQEKYLDDASEADQTKNQVAFLHFLTVIYFDSDEHLPIAVRLADEVLRRDPRNFNALWNRVKIYASSGQKKSKEFKMLRDVLYAVTNDIPVMLTAKIEIADIYNEFLGNIYDNKMRSYSMYKQVLSVVSDLSIPGGRKLSFHNAVSRWRLNLARRHKEMMLSYGDPTSDFQKMCLNELKTMLKCVIEEPDFEGGCDADIMENKLIRSKAMTELANTKFEYFKNSLRSNRIMFGDCEYHCLEADIEYYFNEAIHTIKPSRDAYLCFCYGLYKEYCTENCNFNEHDNKSISGYLEAIDFYQRAFEIDPDDHKLLHRIGLLYYAIWALEDDHIARLQSVRANQRMWMERNLGINIPLYRYEGTRVVMPPKFEALPPDEIPPPYQMVGFNRQMKKYNFLAQDFNNRYLLKSREYFQMANDRAKGSVRFYLVSLARICASLGEEQEALLYLERAEKAEDSINMAGLLYEQWAMLIDKMAHNNARVQTGSDVTSDRALRYYRESLRIKVILGTSTAVTLHYMLKLLYDQTQLEHQRGNVILQKEYFLIYMLIQDDKSAVNILPQFANEEIKIWVAWNLIELLYERNEGDDSVTAFAYLTILAEAGVLRDQPKVGNLTKTDTSMRKDRLVFEVCRRAARTCFLLRKVMSDTHDWLLELLSPDMVEESNELICVIGYSFEDQGVQTVWHLLNDCKLKVTHLCVDEYEDCFRVQICSLPLEFQIVLHHASTVVIVGEEDQNRKNVGVFQSVINLVLKDRRLRPERVCVASNCSKEPYTRMCGIDLPAWKIHEIASEKQRTKEMNFYSMVEALFFQQTGWSKFARHRTTLIYERISNVLNY